MGTENNTCSKKKLRHTHVYKILFLTNTHDTHTLSFLMFNKFGRAKKLGRISPGIEVIGCVCMYMNARVRACIRYNAPLTKMTVWVSVWERVNGNVDNRRRHETFFLYSTLACVYIRARACALVDAAACGHTLIIITLGTRDGISIPRALRCRIATLPPTQQSIWRRTGVQIKSIT